eukprot:TRINITY_DN667_c0_g1_i2.p1 TRINITY_DN667_c0_g1~~TRINITY_DN667_c0_g1_i2.p1  ORF type:complete len:438 (-),score=115.45 TRINITY_DN667_c0_g1_i2:596-1909(-)
MTSLVSSPSTTSVVSRASSKSSADDSSSVQSKISYSSSPGFVKEPCPKLLRKEFDCILTMADDVPEELETVLAEHVVAFCDATGVLEDLLDWFCRLAVDTAEKKMNIFQNGLLRDLLLHTVMNDRSEYWFALLYGKLMEKIDEKEGKPLDRVHGMENLQQLVREFQDILNDSLLDCPVILRRLWNNLKQFMTIKWGEEAEDVLFYRFTEILIQHITVTASLRDLEIKKFEVLKEFLKLFEELASFPCDPSLASFVEENQPKYKEFFNELVDDEEVAICIAVLNASRHGKEGVSKYLQAKINFDSWYNAVSMHAPRTQVSSPVEKIKQEAERDQEIFQEFLEKVASPNWKLIKEKNGTSSYMTNFGENETKALKIVTRVKGSLDFTCSFFGTAIGHPDYNDNVAVIFQIFYVFFKIFVDFLFRNQKSIKRLPLSRSTS